MSRMHSNTKGKSGSNRPEKRTKPVWTRYGNKEIVLLIKKLSKEGNSPSQIGTILRDVYGIPDVRPIINKKITKVLKENKLTGKFPEDLMALIRKAIFAKKHIESNGQDKTALRGLQLTESKIKRLVKYYIKRKVLPEDWKYDPKRLKMYAE